MGTVSDREADIAALEDLRVGVAMDRHHLVDGDAKLRALDAALKALRNNASSGMAARVEALEAARIAYASEFPPDENGDPDVQNIHANIRKLKLDRAGVYPSVAQAHFEVVPKPVIDALKLWTGAEPSQSLLARAVDEWLVDSGASHSHEITAPASAPVADWRAALADLLEYVDRNTCTHEDTHRGGSIWTICDGCGMKWADDEGGFVPHQDAPAVAGARAALASAPAPDSAVCKGSIAQGSGCGVCDPSKAEFASAPVADDRLRAALSDALEWIEGERSPASNPCDAIRAALASAPVAEPPQLRLSPDVLEYLKEGVENATGCEESDVDYDFANELLRLINGPLYTAAVAGGAYQPSAQSTVKDDKAALGIPECGKPLCAPGEHHPLCRHGWAEKKGVSDPVAGEAMQLLRSIREQDYLSDTMRHRIDRLLTNAAPQASEADIIEDVAKQWDGCIYDAGPGGDIDIGKAIRNAASKHKGQAGQQRAAGLAAQSAKEQGESDA